MTTVSKARGAQTHGRLSKKEGSFYTPKPIADAIVELSGVSENATEDSNILDPAAGDGALLIAVIEPLVKRLEQLGAERTDIAKMLVTNLHAIELDTDEAKRCRENLSAEAERVLGINIPSSSWDVIVGDAFDEWHRFASKMDFVLINPPYVRIHNIEEKPESPYVSGMCDLYYAFFDYAQRCLTDRGHLAAIAPSGWMTSASGRAMRNDLHERDVLYAVCDYGHFQVFSPYATTYTALVGIGRRRFGSIAVWQHDGDGRLIAKHDVDSSSIWVGGRFLPDAPDYIGEILDTEPAAVGIAVRNGYATNLNGFFMSERRRFSAHEIPVVKASRGTPMYGIYPYDRSGNLIDFDRLRLDDEKLADALTGMRRELLARTQVDSSAWWCYARTQGIADTYRDKVAVQNLVKPPIPPRTIDAPAGTGVFCGLYVVGMTKGDTDEAVSSAEFFDYVRSLRQYKSGGYYACGGRDLERFLNWWVSKHRR